MEITVLAASGATGRELTRQALARGHTVIAIARNPGRILLPAADVSGSNDGGRPDTGADLREAVEPSRLIRVAADVRDPESIAAALRGREVIVSGLGVAKGDRPGVLTEGARALAAARPGRIVWLGAFGTGPSAAAAGPLTRTLLRLLPDRADKEAADAIILGGGGTVFHAGPLSDSPPGAGDLTIVSNNAGNGDTGLAALLAAGRV
ncbi:NAD(P)H-binding protein, partial [Actinoplanes philippinensis]|uniref:NAD(P)-dependent oxidoreductase n=1 Tax=Actinoplanes philippinensis TaxID=35752 RepID=UPI003F4CE88B